MRTKRADTERFSLKRWSQRKLESSAKPQPTSSLPSPANAATAGTLPAAPAPTVELPPIESLTFDSDFTPFFKPDVDPALQRAALKQLFRDPRFNVMDGLDTYIDDYTKPDPIPSDMLADLVKRFDFSESPPQAAAAVDREAAPGSRAAAAERGTSRPDAPEPSSSAAGAMLSGTAESCDPGAATFSAQPPLAPTVARDPLSNALPDPSPSGERAKPR